MQPIFRVWCFGPYPKTQSSKRYSLSVAILATLPELTYFTQDLFQWGSGPRNTRILCVVPIIGKQTLIWPTLLDTARNPRSRYIRILFRHCTQEMDLSGSTQTTYNKFVLWCTFSPPKQYYNRILWNGHKRDFVHYSGQHVLGFNDSLKVFNLKRTPLKNLRNVAYVLSSKRYCFVIAI